MKQYTYLIAYSYVISKGGHDITVPGRTVVDINSEIREEETIIKIENAIKSTLEQNLKEGAEKNRFSIDAMLNKVHWVGVMSFQLLKTSDVPDPDDKVINVAENL